MIRNRIPELESGRIYGILGIIFQFVGIVANTILFGVGFILSIIGLILLFLAIKSISNYYDNQKPFRYMLFSMISGILSSIIIALLVIYIIFPELSGVGKTTASGFISISNPFILILYTLFLGSLLPLFISIIFQYLAYNTVARLTEINDFHIAALLLLIGIILVTVLIGALLILIGIIFLIMAFNRLPYDAKPAVNGQNQIGNPDDVFI